MSEEKVDLACFAEYLSDLFDFKGRQFWVEIETTQLGDEKFEVGYFHLVNLFLV